MGATYDFRDVQVFTAGTVGRPGQRVFFLQVRDGRRVVTVKCEKQQVGALAQYLDRLLTDLPQVQSEPLPGTLGLMTPIEPEWTLGSMGGAYDRDDDRVVLLLEEFVPTAEDDEIDPELLEEQGRVRLMMTREQAAAFVRHATELIAAGRPTCRWCGFPMDPDGHPCPRMN